MKHTIPILSFLCFLPFLTSDVPGQDYIETLFSIPFEVPNASVSISRDGEWVRRSWTEGQRQEKSYWQQFYSLKNYPTPQTPPINGRLIAWSGKWLLTYKDWDYYLWDITAVPCTPRLKLTGATSKSDGYAGQRRFLEGGSYLAMQYRTGRSTFRTRFWDLNQDVSEESYLTLEEPKGSRSWFVETPDEGLMLARANPLRRWNLKDPSESPEVFQLNVPDSDSDWKFAGGFAPPSPYVTWSDTENWYLTDFPSNPRSPRRWKLAAEPAMVDPGNRRMVTVHDGKFWYSTFEDESVSPEKYLFAYSTFDSSHLEREDSSAFFIGSSKYVGIIHSIVVLDTPIRERTYIVSVENPKSDYVLVGDVEDREKGTIRSQVILAFTKNPKWIVGVSTETQPRFWSTSQPELGAGGVVRGLDEAYASHVLIDDRWLIVGGAEGGLFRVDLSSDLPPRARKFYKLKSDPPRFGWFSHSKNLICIPDSLEQVAHKWDTSQFESEWAK